MRKPSEPMTPQEALRLLNRKGFERTPSPPVSGDLLAQASQAPTILAHERLLRKIKPDALARVGVSQARLALLESGAAKPTATEAKVLERIFREDVGTLMLENTPTARRLLKPLI